jgi:hypothetical protein
MRTKSITAGRPPLGGVWLIPTIGPLRCVSAVTVSVTAATGE